MITAILCLIVGLWASETGRDFDSFLMSPIVNGMAALELAIEVGLLAAELMGA